MKYLTFLSFALLVGCNSNQIGVTRIDPQASTAAPQPGVAKAGVSSSETQPDPTIFFEQIRLRDGLAPVVNGVGFLDRDAENTDPFVVRLAQETEVSNVPAFTPVSGGALLVDRSSSEVTLRFMDIGTLRSTDLLSIPGAVSVASTPSRDTIGWIDTTGNATISKNGHSMALNLGSANIQAKKITSLTGVSEFYVLAQGNSSKILLFNAGSSDPEVSLDADQLAMSPKGDQLLVVNGASVQVYNRSTKTTKSIVVSGQIHEPTWKDEDTVAFWTEKSGQPELDVLNTKTNKQAEVTMLDSSMANAGMICPVLNNEASYFADFRDGKNAIFRASETDGAWNVTSFAEPKDSRFGLICPSVSNYF